MNVWFVGIMMILGIVAALIFAVGTLLIGAGIASIAYCACFVQDPKNTFVIGIDYGKRTADALDRMVEATERSVAIAEKSAACYLGEEPEETVEDLYELISRS